MRSQAEFTVPAQFIKSSVPEKYYMSFQMREKTGYTTKILADDQELEVCPHEYNVFDKDGKKQRDARGWKAIVVDVNIIERTGSHLLEVTILEATKVPFTYAWEKDATVNKVYLKFTESFKTLKYRLNTLNQMHPSVTQLTPPTMLGAFQQQDLLESHGFDGEIMIPADDEEQDLTPPINSHSDKVNLVNQRSL